MEGGTPSEDGMGDRYHKNTCQSVSGVVSRITTHCVDDAKFDINLGQ